MNDPNAERMLRKYKGFTNAIKLMLKQEYKFLGGDNIQDMFVQDLLKEFNKHLKDGWKLDAGQTVWWAAHKAETPGRNKTIEKVQKLFNDGIPVENIASELEMSKALVREYVAIVEEMTKDWTGEKE